MHDFQSILKRHGQLAAIASLWIAFVVLVLVLLYVIGFRPWTIGQFVEVITSTAVVVGVVVLVLAFGFRQEVGRLIDRVRKAKAGGIEAELDAVRENTPLPVPPVPEPIPERPTTPPISFTMPLIDVTEVMSGAIPFEPGSDYAFFWQYPIRPGDLAKLMADTGFMMPFTLHDINNARSIVAKHGQDRVAFLGGLASRKDIIDSLDELIASETKRPRGKAVDPVSFVTWGNILWTGENSPQTREMVRNMIRELIALGWK